MSRSPEERHTAICARVALACALIVFLVSGCDRVAQDLHLRGHDNDIEKATRAIASAQTDAQRAAAYVARGAAIGEKARYSRAFKIIPDDEYARLLEMSLKDHGQAIALVPGNAEMYYGVGHTYYMQAAFSTFDPANDPMAKDNFRSAKATLTQAIERDSRHIRAYEYRGMANEGAGDLDQAIADYTRLAELEPKSRYRLADAHCNRGNNNLRANNQIALAIADYEKSIEIGSSADGCSCEPYNPLMAIYLIEKPDLEKAREVVRRAQAARKRIAPEYLEKLKSAN